MANSQALEQAIVVLESHRSTLGNGVVEMAVAALREKLSIVQARAQPIAGHHDQMTVLVADLSGFTTMSELMDAEEVRDRVNALWEKLDSVVAAWGGKIDRHTGDGLIAVFGVAGPRPDDAERAIQAALDMQMELALFNERALQQVRKALSNWSRTQMTLRMRIGLHTGPVFFGPVGSGGEYMAMGDTVAVANQLEHLAPVGGVLISHDTYAGVHGLFDVHALEPIRYDGKMDLLRLYVVKREKPRAFRVSIRSLEGLETRMVGRDADLEQLQHALQATIDMGMAQVVTIIGEAGIGKTRLLYEFERWLELLPVQVSLFKSRMHQEMGHCPYALIRDLFTSYFDIHPRNSVAVGREKLVRGIVSVMKEDAAHARESAHFIGQLLGFDFSDSPYLQGISHDVRRIRETAFHDVARFFTAVTADAPAAVLFLENGQWADEGSLDLIDYLVQDYPQVPLLIVCLARPSLFKRRPSWQVMESLNTVAYTRLDLAPLSPIDSRHLVSEIVRNLPHVPLNLIDFIVSGAGGNPLYVEELIRMLIEDGILVKEADQWRARMNRLREVTLPPTLAGLFQTRLERLPALELETLQRAAVIGHAFNEAALVQLAQASGGSEEQTESALQSLEARGLIYYRRTSSQPGVREYMFRHDTLHQITYQSLDPAQSRLYHSQAAAWLINRRSMAGDAGAIAYHYEQVGDESMATEWYGRAGLQAKDACALDTAAQLYRRALSLSTGPATAAAQQVWLNEGLAETLARQARFGEAVAAFAAMRAAAQAAADLEGEVRALQGMFLAQEQAGDYAQALVTAQEVEVIARADGPPEQLAIALAAKGWVLTLLGDATTALALAKEALALSTAAVAPREAAYSSKLLSYVLWALGRHEEARQAGERALAVFRKLGDRVWEGLVLRQLGDIARARGDYVAANTLYQDSLAITRDNGDHYAAVMCLRKLAKVAGRQEAYEEAEQYQRQALILAERSGHLEHRARVSHDLGNLYLAQAVTFPPSIEKEAHLDQAWVWFERAWQLARQAGKPLLVAVTQASMARLLIEEERLQEAQAQAQEALAIAELAQTARPDVLVGKLIAGIWRLLGLVAGCLPARELPLLINGRPYDAVACFARSLDLFNRTGDAASFERAQTLRAWALYELHQGDQERGAALWRQASSLFGQLGLTQAVDRLQNAVV